MRLLVLAFCAFFLASPSAYAWQEDFIRSLHNGGALVEDDRGTIIMEHRSGDFFVPASTIKVATAACSAHYFEDDFRFPTDIYIGPENHLYIKGYGDPFLVSEELTLIAKELRQRGITTVKAITLDNSYFDPDVAVDGAANSINPYDALNGALIANFNTVHYVKKAGKIQSAEPQTPLTPLARQVAQQNPGGKQRVNLGKDAKRGARYVGELLQAFLEAEGVAVSGPIAVGPVPSDLQIFYRHLSSKSQNDLLRGMLEFSTNFIANQLFLTMGARQYGAPGTVQKAQQALERCLREHIGWQNFKVVEGAGLSRQNKVTPRQMIQLLRKFQEHRDLLPLEQKHFRAKTGTLRGVNTLVGYFELEDGRTVRFVIFINDSVPFHHRFNLARTLRRQLNLKKP